MDIGSKIKRLRKENELTQEELANRSELTKGYISQIERNLSSPSIATLVDILEALGTTLAVFFNEKQTEKIVFTKKDWFEKKDNGQTIEWIIPNAQKNQMEAIIITLAPDARSNLDTPHPGEEFGYILEGKVNIIIGNKNYIAQKGDAFYFTANNNHFIQNVSKKTSKILWVANPPTF